MKNYIIKTVDGASIPITEEQRDAILREEAAGTLRIFVGDSAIRLNTMNIYPEEVLPQNEGYLHDGTRVLRKFGQWIDALNPEVRLSHLHYPELTTDEVMTPLQFKAQRETILALPAYERVAAYLEAVRGYAPKAIGNRSQTPSLPSGEGRRDDIRHASSLERIGTDHAIDT